MNFFDFRINYLLIVSALFLFSCGDSDTELDPIDNIPTPTEKVFATIYGLILDEDAAAVENATVSLGAETSQTDVNGHFIVKGYFNVEGAYLKVSKEGYFEGAGLVIPYVDAAVQTRMTLVKKDSQPEGESTNKITYSTPDATVEFAENGYTLNGAAYTGSVFIASDYSVPSDVDFGLIFPGNMETDQEGERRALEGYAVLNLELFDDMGNALDLSKPAQVSIDIDPLKLSEAPAEVDLWYLDTDTGLWVKDGIAIRNGNVYEAEVTHFTMWCPGDDYEVFTLSGNVSRAGTVYPSANIGRNYSSTRLSSYSASDGSFSVRVTSISDFILDVEDRCGQDLYTKNIPAPTADIVEEIEIIAGANSYTLNGNVLCRTDNIPAPDAYILVNFGNGTPEVLFTNDLAEFEFFYEDCDGVDIEISAYDPANGTQSGIETINGDAIGLELNTCEEVIQGSLTIERDGEAPYVIQGCTVVVSEFDPNFIPGFTYRVSAIDNFGGSGEYVHYELEINVGIPNEIQPPIGPPFMITPGDDNSSANPPVYYDIYPFDPEVIQEDDESVLMTIQTNTAIKKYENGVSTEVMGRITIDAVKQ